MNLKKHLLFIIFLLLSACADYRECRIAEDRWLESLSEELDEPLDADEWEQRIEEIEELEQEIGECDRRFNKWRRFEADEQIESWEMASSIDNWNRLSEVRCLEFNELDEIDQEIEKWERAANQIQERDTLNDADWLEADDELDKHIKSWEMNNNIQQLKQIRDDGMDCRLSDLTLQIEEPHNETN